MNVEGKHMATITITNIHGRLLATIEAENTADAIQKLAARDANLYRANLDGANLTGANLTGASLYRANLYRANLDGANLDRANLDGANLTGANLTGASLDGANLDGANLDELTRLPPFQICPQEGAFIAYKMAINAKTDVRAVLKLEIPADAQRTSSLVGRKCRASAVKVLSANDGGAEYYSSYDRNFRYHVGAIATPDRFDPDIRRDCANGIHFFITEQEAKDYW